MGSNVNPKLIALNSIYLFLRMLFVLFLSFYITRLALSYLGDEDFGINDVVGGIIVIFAIISMPLTSTIQRFFNVEFSKKTYDPIVVFSTCRRLVFILSIIMFILYETIGLYITNNIINIPNSKLFDANIVYQITIFASIVNLLYLPYQSLLFSKENMKVSAYAEIGLNLFRLIMLLILPFIRTNHLISYSCILCLGYLLVYLFYLIYSRSMYNEICGNGRSNVKLFKSILSFSGWNLLESVAGILQTYGTNILINIFGGVLYNTAYGISKQISNAVSSFTVNVLKAVEPQITTSHVENNTIYRDSLILKAVSSSFLLVSFVWVIFQFSGELILKLWLINIPNYTLEVIKYTLLSCVFAAVILPLRCLLLATGQIKEYFTGVLLLTLLSISVTFYLLSSGYSIILSFLVLVCLNFFKFILAISIVYYKVRYNFSSLIFVLFKCLLGIILLYILCYFLRVFSINDVYYMLISIIMGGFLLLILLAYITFNKLERVKIKNYLTSWKRK